MSRCEDCGCGMSGGFCSNCHEEVFIVKQYADQGMDCPSSINNKANEHINNKERRELARHERNKEHNERRRKELELFGETKLSKLPVRI